MTAVLALAVAPWSPLRVQWPGCVPVGPTFALRGAALQQNLGFNLPAHGWDDIGIIMQEQMGVPGDLVINLSGREAVWGPQPGIFIPAQQ